MNGCSQQSVINTLRLLKCFLLSSMTLANIRYKDNINIDLKAIKFIDVSELLFCPETSIKNLQILKLHKVPKERRTSTRRKFFRELFVHFYI
jgi:hypothetical protein